VADGPFRLFVAVPLPPAPLAACRSLLAAARAGQMAHGIRWVRTENLHLTLRFLGATQSDALPSVERALARAAPNEGAFTVRLGGAGSFPAGRRPRALWIGIEQGADRLASLARAVDQALAPIGIPAEGRPFRPHLTVARTDAGSHADATGAADALRDAAAGWSASFEVARIVLYRSHLSAGPPRYEELASIPLPV
jgi:RNA 2',3'-cyclic 3'-phosphodiesterase